MLKPTTAALIYLNTLSFPMWKLNGINLILIYDMINLFENFENSFLKIGRPIQNPIYNIPDPMGIKDLTRLRLDLSHLNDHEFRHNL